VLQLRRQPTDLAELVRDTADGLRSRRQRWRWRCSMN
jgi:hypothetical protein